MTVLIEGAPFRNDEERSLGLRVTPVQICEKLASFLQCLRRGEVGRGEEARLFFVLDRRVRRKYAPNPPAKTVSATAAAVRRLDDDEPWKSDIVACPALGEETGGDGAAARRVPVALKMKICLRPQRRTQ